MSIEQPIPFIQWKDGKFSIDKKASDILHQIRGKLAVIVVAGPYRTGKSYLLNRLLGRQSGFAVGGSIQACTKGIWLWGSPVVHGDTTYIFLDSEGLGSIEQNQSFDVQIFSLAVLLSSLFVLNTQGTINESALEQLELVVQCTKTIRVKEGSGGDGKLPSSPAQQKSKSGVSAAAAAASASGGGSTEDSELAEHFPHFLWVLRDFALTLQDANGQPISSRQYLEDALRVRPTLLACSITSL